MSPGTRRAGSLKGPRCCSLRTGKCRDHECGPCPPPAGPRGFWAVLTALGSDLRVLGSRRMAALQEGLRRAVAVPMQLAETVASLWPVLQELALCGNPACRSDLQVCRGAGLLWWERSRRGGILDKFASWAWT